VRVVDAIVAILVAFVFQTVLGRYLPFLAAPQGQLRLEVLDLFTVVAAAFGLARGRTAGMFAGAAAGLLQDAFSGGLLGLNGISKTIVGYLSGIAGRHLIIGGWWTRSVFFALATILDVVIVAAVSYAAEDPRVMGEGFTPLYLCIGNAIAGILFMKALEQRRPGDVP
jgi:rod shape-determining protein MreD